jgi:DeoR/GlpR family transcriptional regulator of sugar metabolism
MQVAAHTSTAVCSSNVRLRPAPHQRLAFTSQRKASARLGRMAVRALSQDELKQQAAWKAVEYVNSGMVLGLGTGSTAAFAVDRIADLLDSGDLKDIIVRVARCMPTVSRASTKCSYQ